MKHDPLNQGGMAMITALKWQDITSHPTCRPFLLDFSPGVSLYTKKLFILDCSRSKFLNDLAASEKNEDLTNSDDSDFHVRLVDLFLRNNSHVAAVYS